MENKIIFEQPLNERTRSFLRLEHLFELIYFCIEQNSVWDSRKILESLLEVNDLLSRSDLKTELIKELERHSSMFNSLFKNPTVDQEKLKQIKEDLNKLLTILSDNSYQPGAKLKQDELITSFKQRISIPGGSCNFDLPRFHYWLNQPENKRKQDIKQWLHDFEPINRATNLALGMLRSSTNPIKETAENGFYQKPIDQNLSCQLIRVLLPAASHYYPEISGGKHRFTIYFMEESDTSVRTVKTHNDVDFELHCCIL